MKMQNKLAEKDVINNFLPLVGFNDDLCNFQLISMSSGFLYFYKNKIFLYGALHGILSDVNTFNLTKQKVDNIAVELYFETNKGAVLLPFKLDNLNYSSSHSLSKKSDFYNDFFCVEIPKKYYFQLRNTIVVNHLENKKEISHHKIFNKIGILDKYDTFAFAGNINLRYQYLGSQPFPIKITDIQSDTNLKFLNHNDDHTISFRLSNHCNDIKEYAGCSGSPIVNSKNELVSIAIRVDCNKNMLVGVDLNYFNKNELLKYLMS